MANWQPSVITDALKRSSLPVAARRYFIGLTRTRTHRGLRAGRLDPSRYAAALAGSDAIYRRKDDARKLDAAITLLVDCSYSMRGRPRMTKVGVHPDGDTLHDAFIAAASLADALNLPGITTEIIGFTEDGSDLIHHPIKRRTERWNIAKALDEMAKLHHVSGNNSDGENLAIAYDDMLQCKQSNKIIVVLSDGAPNAYGHPASTMNDESQARKMIDTIQADGKVKLYAIGFGDFDGLNYTHHKIISDPSDVTKTLLEIIEEVF